ncbi:hypothetical protein BZG36_03182 [Bifiguratus adelaidae]|uniref:Uncharacterized protein n=1 Tax=Bifiguratus adelaidae TaxID=1938954 RepID=A0A261XYJ0_9FUNG|nr:hypothetical protein BZG36_03182 [Bifiguratus adelaidae]
MRRKQHLHREINKTSREVIRHRQENNYVLDLLLELYQNQIGDLSDSDVSGSSSVGEMDLPPSPPKKRKREQLHLIQDPSPSELSPSPHQRKPSLSSEPFNNRLAPTPQTTVG